MLVALRGEHQAYGRMFTMKKIHVVFHDAGGGHRNAAIALKAAGVVSIAVCYLFSFMNPAHEQRSGALIG